MTSSGPPSSQTPQPPRVPRLICALFLPRSYRDHQLGDLAEEFRALASTRGERAAGRWYWTQALASIRPNLALRLRHWGTGTGHGDFMLETVWQDIRYGARGIRKNPGSAVISALTLAMAMGVNTAIFSLVSIVAFADLPMEDPDGMGFVWMSDANTGETRVSLSYQDLVDLRENGSFESLAGFADGSAILSGDGDPIRVEAGLVTDNFWDNWRVPMVVGRGFLPGEDLPGAEPVALLSHGFWQDRYGGDPDVLGRTLQVNGRAHMVVGVVSPIMELGNLADASIWLPLGEPRTGGDRTQRRLLTSGRLRPGATLEQASEEMAALGARLAEEHPETNHGMGVYVQDTLQSLVGENVFTILLLMTVSVCLVLLIACANVANLLLARATGRLREFAMRSTLGARRMRIIRQLFTEGVMISLAAGLVGLGLAHGLLRLMVHITRGQEVFFTMATLDREVLVFTLLVTMAAPLVFGLLPALRAGGTDPIAVLKEGGARSGGSRRMGRTREALVVSQISMALMLMILAGVAARTIFILQTLDPGFQADNVLSMVVELPEGAYPDADATRRFFTELRTEARAIPDAVGAALVNRRPGLSSEERLEIEGTPAGEEGRQYRAARTVVTPGYLDVLGIPLFQGRDFTPWDNAEAVGVAIVNRAAAERYWPGEDPIGRRIRLGPDPQPWLRIVGVAGGTEIPISARSIHRSPQIYLPAAQHPRRSMTLLIRTRGEPSMAASAARSAVWAIDPAQPVDDVRTMEEYWYDFQSTDLALVTLFGTFALFSLVMAAMGIYGVMSYMVSERRAEISLRMALGAEGVDVLRMILLKGGRLLVLGTAIGVVGALFLSQMLASFAVEVSPRDPLTFVGVPLFLALVAFVANVVPALRATRTDPMQAIRTE